ncbi:imelysin family protein [Thalassospira sp. SM2505]|uniref:imelysin family protein n=1 Tax=Thalassospira profundimaris TaxID=502049 RepID=UPI000DEDA54F|nr:imelysin family protein [Thalassospira profundimaris]
MFKKPVLLTAALASCLAISGNAFATDDAEIRGLENVKQFTLDHNERLISQAGLLENAVSAYADIIASHDGNYAAAWQAKGPVLAGQIQNIRTLWLEASNQYETIEGIVAGIPETAKYDLILDAGNPGTENEDIAQYDLTLPDGTVLSRPGNLFHGITEPLFWGMEESHIKLVADLNDDGKQAPGEMLFDANLGLGAAQALTHWAKKLHSDMSVWKPNRDDAFTSVVTMTPTVGDYFGEWKESQFITGEVGAFVAQSRLADVQGIMGGCKKMYFNAISPVVSADNPDLDSRIKSGFEELLSLVEDTYAREKSGEKFGIEEADALGNEAQDIADRIVAMILQAAAQNKVNIRG